MVDVTGHGVPAAMNATLLKAHFYEGCECGPELLNITQHVNRRFTELTLDGVFASAVFFRVVPETRRLQIVNAGHDACLYRAINGGIREFTSSGPLLGLAKDFEWSVEEVEYEAGDRFLLYTDGITETFNNAGCMFGRGSVEKLLDQTSGITPTEVLNRLLKRLDNYREGGPQLDDVTALLIEFQ